jgi:hypothetical protein
MNSIRQNQKYKCKYNIKLIYLTFIHCAFKFERHKLVSFLSENREQTFPNKKFTQSNAHENHEQSFPPKAANKQTAEII